MQEQSSTKNCCKENQNHHLYAQLVENKLIDLIFMSKYDESIFHARFTNQNLPQSCINLFGDVEGLYQFIDTNGNRKESLSINDIGGVTLMEVIEKKGKQIKVQSAFQTQKRVSLQDLNHFYLKIIRYWQRNGKNNILQSSSQQKTTPSNSNPTNTIRHVAQYKKTKLTIDVDNNPFLKSFSKVHNKVKIEEYSKNRIKLFFNEVIPKNSTVFFVIRVLNVKSNVFAFGIIDKKQNRENKSLYSMCYDFFSGDLKDSGYIREHAECKWRKVGRPTFTLKNAVLRMQVDTKEYKITFYCNDQWVCQTVITNHLRYRDFVPYISVKHQGDQFLLNDE